jgi:FkbM family methyltransferase
MWRAILALTVLQDVAGVNLRRHSTSDLTSERNTTSADKQAVAGLSSRRNATSGLTSGRNATGTDKQAAAGLSSRRNTTSGLKSGKNAAGTEKQAPLELQPGSVVYDFGFYNGADSRAYLSAGLKVIAVEADPTLVQAAHHDAQMQVWLGTGQLTLVNTAIAPDGAQPWTTFYMNKCTQEWNSFYSSIGCRTCPPPHTESPESCTAVPVTATTCASVLQNFGVPAYFKLDIEGAESGCYAALAALPQPMRPFLLSAEVGNAELVDTFHNLGYQSFKLVQQQSGITGAWGVAAQDCRTGNLWRSYLGAKAELVSTLAKPAVEGDTCPGSLVGGVWYDLHASMQVPQAW